MLNNLLDKYNPSPMHAKDLIVLQSIASVVMKSSQSCRKYLPNE